MFIQLFKQRCQDIYIQDWHASLALYPKLDTYCNIKHSFGREKYFSVSLREIYRNALCRFRISAHALRIEKDRHLHKNRLERICCYCNTNSIEDEFHFCLICPFYNDLRVKYLPKYFYSAPSYDKFNRLLMSESAAVIRNLSKYVFFAMKKRTDSGFDTTPAS